MPTRILLLHRTKIDLLYYWVCLLLSKLPCFNVPSMSALWLCLPYQLSQGMPTLVQRASRVMKNSSLHTVNCFMHCTFMFLSSDNAKYMLSFVPKWGICHLNTFVSFQLLHSVCWHEKHTKCLCLKIIIVYKRVITVFEMSVFIILLVLY